MRTITDPSQALRIVGKENSELHEEMARCHAELDLYRDALIKISKMIHSPSAVEVAKAALAQRRVQG